MAYDQDTIKGEVIDMLAEGTSLRRICDDEAMPNRSTIMRWLDEDEEFATRYARAKEIGLDNRADKLEEDIEAEQDVQRAKLKFEYGRWYLSKLSPKKYGDSAMVRHADADGEKLKSDDTAIVTRLAALASAIQGRDNDASDDAG